MPSPTSPHEEVQPSEPTEPVDQQTSYLFNPLFTLIRDTSTSEYYHPSTHYVFADDDTDAITTAAMHSLDLYSIETPEPHSPRAGALDVDVEERYIIVDLAPDTLNSTLEVRESACLSPRWAVTDASVRPAPVFGAADDDTGGNMMVVVEGIGISQEATSRGDKAPKGKTAEMILRDARERCGGSITAGLGDIYASLRSGLGVLNKIMEAHRPPEQQP